jgi:hypothetical protein
VGGGAGLFRTDGNPPRGITKAAQRARGGGGGGGGGGVRRRHGGSVKYAN